jgi:hypothetical protein
MLILSQYIIGGWWSLPDGQSTGEEKMDAEHISSETCMVDIVFKAHHTDLSPIGDPAAFFDKIADLINEAGFDCDGIKDYRIDNGLVRGILTAESSMLHPFNNMSFGQKWSNCAVIKAAGPIYIKLANDTITVEIFRKDQEASDDDINTLVENQVYRMSIDELRAWVIEDLASQIAKDQDIFWREFYYESDKSKVTLNSNVNLDN